MLDRRQQRTSECHALTLGGGVAQGAALGIYVVPGQDRDRHEKSRGDDRCLRSESNIAQQFYYWTKQRIAADIVIASIVFRYTETNGRGGIDHSRVP